MKLPTQARLGDVDAQRIFQILAAEIADCGGDHLRGEKSEGQCDESFFKRSINVVKWEYQFTESHSI